MISEVFSLIEKVMDKKYNITKISPLLNEHSFVVKDGNEIIGCCLIKRMRRFEAILEYICIDNQYEGKGIGTMMMDKLFRQFTRISLHVKEDNSRAITFYHKLNFEQCQKPMPNFYTDGSTALVMRWKR